VIGAPVVVVGELAPGPVRGQDDAALVEDRDVLVQRVHDRLEEVPGPRRIRRHG
jgi:hypothetical protein